LNRAKFSTANIENNQNQNSACQTVFLAEFPFPLWLSLARSRVINFAFIILFNFVMSALGSLFAERKKRTVRYTQQTDTKAQAQTQIQLHAPLGAAKMIAANVSVPLHVCVHATAITVNLFQLRDFPVEYATL